MRAVGQPDRGTGAGNLFHRHAVREIAKPRPAIFFIDGYTVQAERAHFGPQVAREHIVAVDGRRARRDTILGEAVDRLTQHVGLGTETEIEARPCRGDHKAAARLIDA